MTHEEESLLNNHTQAPRRAATPNQPGSHARQGWPYGGLWGGSGLFGLMEERESP